MQDLEDLKRRLVVTTQEVVGAKQLKKMVEEPCMSWSGMMRVYECRREGLLRDRPV